MAAAMVSVLTGRVVRGDLAMTGEVTRRAVEVHYVKRVDELLGLGAGAGDSRRPRWLTGCPESL